MKITDTETEFTAVVQVDECLMKTTAHEIEIEWLCKNGKPKATTGAEEIKNLKFEKLKKEGGMYIKQRPVRRRKKRGYVERKNCVIKKNLE